MTLTSFPCDIDAQELGASRPADRTQPLRVVEPVVRWDNSAIVTMHAGETTMSLFADDRAEFKATAELSNGEPYTEITVTAVDGTILHLALSLPAQAKLAAAITRSRA